MVSPSSKLFIGSHVSIRNGFLDAAKTAHRMGAKAFQYFPKNPRSLAVKTLDRRDAEACKQYCLKHNMLSIAHAPYPTNLAADSIEQRERIVRSIQNDLVISEACGSIGLVVHFGKYSGANLLQRYHNSIQCINDVLSMWNGDALLLIENQAGEGTKIGTTLEECVRIRELSKFPEKIGFCFDTCHAFASGLWKNRHWSEVMTHAEKLGYLEHLQAVHLNDSRFPSGSYRDRHSNIGQGFIRVDRIKQILNTPHMSNIPIILETPAIHGSHELEIQYTYQLLK